MKKSIGYLLSLLVTFGFAQAVVAQTTLTGSVLDATQQPLIGANVILKNTTIGVAADVQGNFKLEIPDSVRDGVLMVSSIGFQSQEIPIGGTTVFHIVLLEDAQTLNEVVVTGYQTEERGKILGAVNTVSPELITKIPVSGIDQALQGRVPGVVVTQNTGAPGEGVSVRIRGTGSLGIGANGPLYIVDGLPTLDITSISPQDILSLTVLKDASAAAIYGSRATNGVVLITTKMGSADKLSIQVTSQVGFQDPVRLVPMANTDQYVKIYNEANAADNNDRPAITDAIKAGLANVDQVKAIMRTHAPLQTHGLSISGAQGKTRYLISGNYFKQDGIIKASDYSRLTGRINLDTEVKKWLTAGVNLNLSSATTDLIGSSGDGAGGNGGSVVRYAYFRSPALPIYDAQGNFTDKTSTYALFGDGYNPVGMLAYNYNKRLTDRIFGKFYVVLTPLKGLTFTSNFGVDLTNQNQRRFDRNWGTDNRINKPNRLTVTNDRNRTLTFSNFANYNRVFGKQSITVLIGTEAIQTQNYSFNGTDTRFATQDPTLTYLNNGLGPKTVSESRNGNALLSFFGKASYDLNEKYLVSGTLRRDGSSRFGANNRWGTFYAGSLGWRIDKESFLTNSQWIDKLLLRGGYGVVGNQEIPNYAFSDQIAVGYNYPFGNAPAIGYGVSYLGNSKIRWESSHQSNVGVDFTAWGGKFSMSVDYFDKTTSDLLVNQPIASSVGFLSIPPYSPYTNNGKIQNRGLEFGLNYSNTTGGFHYSISPNVAFLHNEVKSVDAPIRGGAYGSLYTTLTETGHPVGSFYLLEMDGIFQNDAEIFTSAKPPGTPLHPGDVKFKDKNNDGTIDASDRRHLGSAIPTMTAGLNIAVNYSRFDLSIFFQGAYGQKILSVLNRDIEGFYRSFNVTERYYSNHWTPENPSNQYPRASWDASGNNAQISSRFLEDGSYTRLKNLQLGFTLPKTTLEKYGFTAARIYISGTNLLTITKYSGMDPEMTVSDNSRNDGDRARGIDWGTFPAARTFNLGVNITF